MRSARLLAAASLVAAIVGAGVVAHGSAGRVDEGAAADHIAERGVQALLDGSCDLTTAEAIGTRHPEVRQLVVLATDSFEATHGTAFVAARTAGGWACQSEPVHARFGREGTRLLVERRSGDGTTPAGVFPLGETTAWDGETFHVFGNRPDPGVRTGIGYRDVRNEDCWGATPNDPDYQHLVNDPGCPGPDDEWLPRFGDVYSHAAVIGANLDPISGDEPGEPPYAAAIFLHRHSFRVNGSTRPTSGCVSLGYDDLVETINLFDPTLDPHFAIGPTDWLRTSA